MDNQKSSEAKGSNIGSSGSSIGKDSTAGNLGKSAPGSQGKDQLSGSSIGSSTGSSTGGATASNIGSSSTAGSMGAMTSAAGSGVGGSNSQAASSGGSTTSGSQSSQSSQSAIGDSKDIKGQVEAKAQDAHQTIDKAADAAKPLVDKAVDTVQQAANGVQPLVDRLATTAHAGVDRLQGVLSGAGSSLGERQQQLTDAAGQWMEATRDYVREKPATALGIAAAAGFILAKLMGGSRRDY